MNPMRQVWLGALHTFQSTRYIFCVSGDFVKVYSTATEECVHILHGHRNLVTGIQLNPNNHLQLKGVWLIKLSSGEKSNKLLNKEKPDIFQLVSVKLPKSSSQEVEAKELSIVLDYINQSPKFTLSSSKNKKHAKNNFTCVACHPKEDCIASGHMDGKIRLWSSWKLTGQVLDDTMCCEILTGLLGFSAQKPQEIGDTFSPIMVCGAMTSIWRQDPTCHLDSLLSGGRESVLVEWRDATEKNKEFLPRLGATIEHISVSPAGDLFCTSHSDNKIMIIHRNLEASAVIQGLLDIMQQEYINDYGLNQIELTKAAFGCFGNWLATVEQRQEKETELELQMKLWMFILNTKIHMPHEDCITALCFCNAEKSEQPTLVTASKDGYFKVWILTDDSDIYKKAVGWTCDFVGSYHKYQATNCCFSEDVEWSAKLNVRVMEPDPNSENIAAISQSSVEFIDIQYKVSRRKTHTNKQTGML
ncbi:hypothetical protein P7K49_013871 [Saguinus oedipus]|uniref:WD repeat-containing protein 75 second beta-propeller domain-containing protein n=1 Tax=Saguinus oedipus TaxID=9490 RepID=A0ABQ9VHB3_SAGOE|nr:hypothetical protein P7K49_013871 [Saguinus oedipus]